MNTSLAWTKCRGNVWGYLQAVDLSHRHFDNLKGIYVIWHGGVEPLVVRIGKGLIRDELEAARVDPTTQAYRKHRLFVTWAAVSPEQIDGVEFYLVEALQPLIRLPVASVKLIPVMLPCEVDTKGGAHQNGSRSEEDFPDQEWQDLVEHNEFPEMERSKPPPAPPPPKSRTHPGISVQLADTELLSRLTLVDIMKSAVAQGASDILMVPNEPPILRINGVLRRFQRGFTLSPEKCQSMIYSMLSEDHRAQFEGTLDLDCSVIFQRIGHFRVNVFRQSAGVGCAMRVILSNIPTPGEIGLSPAVVKLAGLPRGLILITGPTGSGKSTTLASLIEFVNNTQNKNIVTIEDPIEFDFKNKFSAISQREIGTHTQSFSKALKYALRQSPDIIVVGEMRDRETMDMALNAAETGHLCFSTLHTQDAPYTVHRILNEFPSDQQDKLRPLLGATLKAVISQTLVPKLKGGQICAREVMIVNSGISSMIRDGHIHQLRGAIESGGAEGMCTMDQHLVLLCKQGFISFAAGLSKAQRPTHFKELMESSESKLK